jgi:methionine--tRNA ligase beta chain
LCGSAGVTLRACGSESGPRLRLADGSCLRELPAIAQALAAAGGARGEALVGGSSGAARGAEAEWLARAQGAALADVDAAAAQRAFLAGARFTLADAAVYFALAPALHAAGAGDALRAAPHAARWAAAVAAELAARGAQGAPMPPPTLAAALAREPLRLYATASSAAAAPPLHKPAPKAAAAPAAAKAPAKAAPAAPAPAPAAAPAPAPAAAAPAAAPAPASAPTAKKEKPEKKAAAPAPAEAAVDPAAFCDLRVGVITKIWPHPEAERLFCEEIDVGEGAPRPIASGLREHYKLEELVNRRVVVACNLKPRPLVGYTSNGMVLAATSAAGKVELLDPPAGAPAGERVTFAGLANAPAAEPNAMAKKKHFDLTAEHLRVDDALRACYKGAPMMTSAGAVTVPSAAGGTIH